MPTRASFIEILIFISFSLWTLGIVGLMPRNNYSLGNSHASVKAVVHI